MPDKIITLHNEYIQLEKLIKLAGWVPSGGMAKALIKDGCIKVDGVVESRRGAKIRSGQYVEMDDQRVRVEVAQ